MSAAPVTVGAGGVAVGLGVLIGAYVLWKASKAAGVAAKVVGAAAQAVNPLNHDNVFATSVNDVGAAVAGDANWTLGGAFYDFDKAVQKRWDALWTPAFNPGIKDSEQSTW